MAYTPIDYTKPDPATQGITDFGTSVRNNIKALRDMIVAGTLLGFNATVSGGTAEQPTQVKHNRGTSEYIKEVIVWGTTGGATDNPETITYSYSTDDSTYDTIGTIAYTYDANGNVTAWAWS